jgi:hypothetical protein
MTLSIIGNIAGRELKAMLPATLRDLKKSVRYLLLCIKRTPPTNDHFKAQDRVLHVPKNGKARF